MLYDIITALQGGALAVNELLKKDAFDYLESKNSTGDIQLELDVEANRIFKEALLALDSIKGICSEEESEIILKDTPNAAYIVAFDPLDGSSIVDSNLSVGSIFGIYNENLSGKNLIAAGYVLYGPRLEMVVAQNDVNHYIFSSQKWRCDGSFTLNNSGKINAPGGIQKDWSTNHKILIESFFQEGYRLRYSGGMVPDLHNILRKKGGIFSYPATAKNPRGKLRAFFEVFPFAFIFEKAQGGAIDGKNRLLDCEVSGLHESLPCFFGSRDEIERVKNAYKNEVK